MRYETPEDAVEFLAKTSPVTIDRKSKEITHGNVLSLRTVGALSYLKKQGFSIRSTIPADNWNIHVK